MNLPSEEERPWLDGIPVIYVHPADVDLPAVKAEAARLSASVIASPSAPRGRAYIAPRGSFTYEVGGSL